MARPRTFSQDDVEALWAAYRSEVAPGCPVDGKNFMLSIDGTTKSYRLVCACCGLATPWFVASPDGVVLRAMGTNEMTYGDDDPYRDRN